MKPNDLFIARYQAIVVPVVQEFVARLGEAFDDNFDSLVQFTTKRHKFTDAERAEGVEISVVGVLIESAMMLSFSNAPPDQMDEHAREQSRKKLIAALKNGLFVASNLVESLGQPPLKPTDLDEESHGPDHVVT